MTQDRLNCDVAWLDALDLARNAAGTEILRPCEPLRKICQPGMRDSHRIIIPPRPGGPPLVGKLGADYTYSVDNGSPIAVSLVWGPEAR